MLHAAVCEIKMASYTATEALDLILDSSEDLQSGDESDIQEDPLFPLPRVDESGDDSEAEGECADEGDEVSESGDESEDAGRLNNY